MFSLSTTSLLTPHPKPRTLLSTHPLSTPLLLFPRTKPKPKPLTTPLHSSSSSSSLSTPTDDSPDPSLFPMDPFLDKDYSFLDSTTSPHNTRRIISSANLTNNSRILVSMGTTSFIDHILDFTTPPCDSVVAIHDSLFALAMIKESHEEVRCWNGEIAALPDKFLPVDVVFVCYFPGMGVGVGELLTSVARCCSPGARLVISFEQGREIIEHEHRRQHPDIVKSDLPDRTALEKAATDHLFQITEFVDVPDFYLAVLKYHE